MCVCVWTKQRHCAFIEREREILRYKLAKEYTAIVRISNSIIALQRLQNERQDSKRVSVLWTFGIVSNIRVSLPDSRLYENIANSESNMWICTVWESVVCESCVSWEALKQFTKYLYAGYIACIHLLERIRYDVMGNIHILAYYIQKPAQAQFKYFIGEVLTLVETHKISW